MRNQAIPVVTIECYPSARLMTIVPLTLPRFSPIVEKLLLLIEVVGVVILRRFLGRCSTLLGFFSRDPCFPWRLSDRQRTNVW